MSERKDLIGQVLQDTYRIERLIGEGGMGVVYEVAHLRLFRRFAVKVLNPEIADHSDAFARFRREAEITSALRHPHILEVIDFNCTPGGTPYIVMELLYGENLYDRIQHRGPLELPQVGSIFRQTCSALEAAHNKKIIHRDLKPQNIFLCKRGDRDDFVKVVDFGISKVLGAHSVLTKTQSLMGSPFYMSPEQAKQKTGEVDLRTDIFAMGSILFEMLAGCPPFTGDSVPALLYQIAYHRTPDLHIVRPDIPPSIEHVVNTALAKRRNHRFDSMRTFWNAFAEALEQEDIEYSAPTEDRQADWAKQTLPPDVQGGIRDASLESEHAEPAAITHDSRPPVESGVTGPQGVRRSPASIAKIAALAVVLATAALLLGIQLVPKNEARAPAPASPDQPARAATVQEGAPDVQRSGVRSLFLDSRPADAEVLLDGRLLGKTPLRGLSITTRGSTLLVRKAGYMDRHLPIGPGKESLLLGVLELRALALPKAKRDRRVNTSTLQISALADGQLIPADVYLDGKMIGQAPLFRSKVAAGIHVVEARLEGYKGSVKRLRLRPGQNRKIVLELQR